MLYRIFAISFLSLLPGVLFSQEMQDSIHQLPQFDVVANHLFQKEQAGMKETGVDSLVLHEKANLSLSELLSENTSVFIKDHGRGALSTASFRGTASSHTQVNWNGININAPMTGMVDFSLIPVYIIDDINLKHGTASIVDNSGGLGGSVNISNRANWGDTLGFRYVQGVGSYNTFNEFAQFNIGNKKVHSNTRLYHDYSKNDYTFINRRIADIDPETGDITNPRDTNKNADYTKYGFLQELYYMPNGKHIVSAKWWSQWADRTLPQVTSYEGPDASNLNNQDIIDHKLVVDWNYYSNRSKITTRSGYSRKQLDYVQKNNVPGLGKIPAIYSESNQESFLNHISYTYKIDQDFSIKANFDANYHDVLSKDSVQKTGYEEQRSELSSFLALSKGFWNRLNINFMLRQDWIDQIRSPIIPFLGVDFRLINDKDLYLKANVARNYNQPSLNDLYWQPGGNPNLLPEDGINYEIGFEYHTMLDEHKLQTDLTIYRSDINNWIIWVPSFKGYWEPNNIKRVLSQGVEVYSRLDGDIGDVKYRTSATYAYTSSKNYGDPLVWGDNSYGKQLVYVPLHSGNLIFNIAYKGFSFTYQYNAYSERFTTSSNDISRRDRLYPYFMNDVSLKKDFGFNRFDLSAEVKVYNMFDETYHSILYRPMPGRNYMLLLTVDI